MDPRSNMLRGFAGYFDKVMTKFIINNRTDALQTDITFFLRQQIVKLPALAH